VCLVSVEAISWALNLAPFRPTVAGSCPAPCKFVLVGLANHAGPDGTGAFPSVATLVRYTGRSERTIRTSLENSYAWIMKLADGQVIDGTAFYDSISFNHLWARVQPR
jgi:hypothetical protein